MTHMEYPGPRNAHSFSLDKRQTNKKLRFPHPLYVYYAGHVPLSKNARTLNIILPTKVDPA